MGGRPPVRVMPPAGLRKTKPARPSSFAPLFEAPDQLPDNRLRFTANHDVRAVRHQVFGEKIGVDAPGQEADAGVELAQTANLGASDRVVRRDDREPDDRRPKLGDSAEETDYHPGPRRSVEDADLMAGSFEDGAQEANAQGYSR